MVLLPSGARENITSRKARVIGKPIRGGCCRQAEKAFAESTGADRGWDRVSTSLHDGKRTEIHKIPQQNNFWGRTGKFVLGSLSQFVSFLHQGLRENGVRGEKENVRSEGAPGKGGSGCEISDVRTIGKRQLRLCRGINKTDKGRMASLPGGGEKRIYKGKRVSAQIWETQMTSVLFIGGGHLNGEEHRGKRKGSAVQWRRADELSLTYRKAGS